MGNTYERLLIVFLRTCLHSVALWKRSWNLSRSWPRCTLTHLPRCQRCGLTVCSFSIRLSGKSATWAIRQAKYGKIQFWSTQEFFDQWLKVYNATTGRLVEILQLAHHVRNLKNDERFLYLVNLYAAGWIPVLITQCFLEQWAKCMKRQHLIWKGNRSGEI